MVQHYMLSSKSKNLNLKQIFRLSEDEAFQLLKTNRWGNSNDITDVVCPHCGIRHNAYFLQSRKRWCCKALPTSFLHYHQHYFLFS